MTGRTTIAWSIVTILIWAGIWVLLDGQLTVGAMAFALVVGFVTARLSTAHDNPRALFGAGLALVRLGGLFLRELIVSNMQQLRIVLGPRIDIQPRWVEIETRLETDFGRSLLAILVSMTPGTLSCEVSQSKLLVHVLDTDDHESIRRRLQERLETPILRLEQSQRAAGKPTAGSLKHG